VVSAQAAFTRCGMQKDRRGSGMVPSPRQTCSPQCSADISRSTADAPSLALFQARLDGALSTLGWWKVSLLMAGGVEPDDLQGPFQPKPVYDSMMAEYQAKWICCLKCVGFLPFSSPSHGKSKSFSGQIKVLY